MRNNSQTKNHQTREIYLSSVLSTFLDVIRDFWKSDKNMQKDLEAKIEAVKKQENPERISKLVSEYSQEKPTNLENVKKRFKIDKTYYENKTYMINHKSKKEKRIISKNNEKHLD